MDLTKEPIEEKKEIDQIIDEEFGEWVYIFRRKLGLSRNYFEFRYEITAYRLKQIEKGIGKGVTFRELEAIARALKYPFDVLRARASGEIL